MGYTRRRSVVTRLVQAEMETLEASRIALRSRAGGADLIRDYKSDDLGRCCTRCLYVAAELPTTCPDHPSGKHWLLPWEMWVCVGSFTLYGVRALDRAMRCFSDQCGGEPEAARRLTPEEFRAIRTGAAHLEINIVYAQASSPEPEAQR